MPLIAYVWGIYSQPKEGKSDNTEIYYLGVASNQTSFNDVGGKETSHNIGIRQYEIAVHNFSYNSELIMEKTYEYTQK